VSSNSPALSDKPSADPATPARSSSPWKNPSYPARTHWHERPALEEKLKSWQKKIEAVAQKLAVLGASPGRASYERLYHQMLGARDQLSEAVRRLPREAGALYHEDHERLENAEAALSRLFRSWDGLKT
jgi:hypothetical protein